MRHAKDAKEFNTSLSKSMNKDGSISWICRVPKPIVEKMGSPTSIKFVVGKKITVEVGKNK
jgi:hypothetical protein